MKEGEKLEIRVTGKVQGVFFRDSTKEKAKELGIKGFVRNEDDGSVYLEAEGEKMDSFVSWLKSGPPKAEVKDVKTKKLKSDRSFKDFRVER